MFWWYEYHFEMENRCREIRYRRTKIISVDRNSICTELVRIQNGNNRSWSVCGKCSRKLEKHITIIMVIFVLRRILFYDGDLVILFVLRNTNHYTFQYTQMLLVMTYLRSSRKLKTRSTTIMVNFVLRRILFYGRDLLILFVLRDTTHSSVIAMTYDPLGNPFDIRSI